MKNSWRQEKGNTKKIKKNKTIYLNKLNRTQKGFFENKLRKYEEDMKNTWKVLNTIIGKPNIYKDIFPSHLIIKKSEVANKKIFGSTLAKN